jgi:hypothetical protein
MNKKVISIVAIIALVAILGVCLVACNADSYAKKLEKAGYVVEKFTGDDAAKEAEAEGVKWAVMGVKLDGLTPKMVSVVGFDNADDAKAYADMAKDLAGEDCVSISGKVVIIASSSDALKDAK